MEELREIKLNNTEEVVKKQITEVTFVKYKNEQKVKVFKVFYTDKHFIPNTRHVFYNTKTKEITFTDETTMSKSLAYRILTEIEK